jgi:NDP-sugar pyrophosphorylase family protein
MIGILPCSGAQTRMKELVFSKELLPLFNGQPVIKHSIEALYKTTPHIVASVHPKKKDLIRYLKKYNVKIRLEPRPTGLPTSIAFAANNYQGPILFALPDTYYQPKNVFKQLVKHPQENVVGLFKSAHPERFDSIKLNPQGQITHYAVKVDPPLSPWTMGCGKLSSQALSLLRATPSSKEHLFGQLIQPLVKQKALFGLTLESSLYFDLGTPGSYIEYLMHHYAPQTT